MIDGCSRLVAGFASMPIKNPILIYEFFFRPAILKYGICDQLRMDHGREFCLVIFVQHIIVYLRADIRRAPFKLNFEQCCRTLFGQRSTVESIILSKEQ